MYFFFQSNDKEQQQQDGENGAWDGQRNQQKHKQHWRLETGGCMGVGINYVYECFLQLTITALSLPPLPRSFTHRQK